MQGGMLRDARKGRGLTLTALSKKTGLAASHISQIERDISKASLSALGRLAGALELDITALFAGREPNGGAVATRKNERTRVRFGRSGPAFEILSPQQARHGVCCALDVLALSVPPGGVLPQNILPGNAELLLYLLEGSLCYTMGDSETELTAGSSLYLPQRGGGVLVNRGAGATRVICGGAPPRKGVLPPSPGTGVHRSKADAGGFDGRKIRARREEKKMTLGDVSQKTGLSASHLSQIERGLAEPSLPALRSLSSALSLPLPLLFASGSPGGGMVTDVADRPRARLGCIDFAYLTPAPSGREEAPNMAVGLEWIPGGGGDGDSDALHGHDFVDVILEGTLDISFPQETFRLSAGDSFFVPRGIPHRLCNPADEEVLILAFQYYG